MIDKNISDYSLSFKRISKNAYMRLVKILIALGLLYYLITSIEYEQITSAINNANLEIILIVFFFGILNVYLQYSKWRITCKEILGIQDNSKIFRSLFYGFSAGIITPFRIGEYFGRAIEFRDKSLIQITVATLVDKFFPLLMVASIGSVSSLLFIYYYFNVSIYLVISLFILIFTFFYLFILLLLSNRFWDSMIFSKFKSSGRFSSFIEKLKIFENLDRVYFYKMLVISFLFYSCFLVQYALLVTAFSHHNNFIQYFWAGNLVMFAKTLIPPISFGELGIREGASVYFITQIGEMASVGFNSSIFLFIINLLIPALVGVGMFLRKNDN